MLYLKYGIPALVILAAGGYIFYLKTTLDATHERAAALGRRVAALEEDLRNANTRREVEDEVRRDPNSIDRLRRDYTRPD